MNTKLIKLSDGTLVQVETSLQNEQLISSSMAEKVESSIEKIKPILKQACAPIISAWNDLSEFTHIEQAEVELAFSFEAEGNLFITKGKAEANLTVKLTFKPSLK
jgi:Trypsin-co-occurring domain 1